MQVPDIRERGIFCVVVWKLSKIVFMWGKWKMEEVSQRDANMNELAPTAFCWLLTPQGEVIFEHNTSSGSLVLQWKWINVAPIQICLCGNLSEGTIHRIVSRKRRNKPKSIFPLDSNSARRKKSCNCDWKGNQTMHLLRNMNWMSSAIVLICSMVSSFSHPVIIWSQLMT